ncbi:MAG: vanadium-dependent haloperoxidase [Bacteroidota bacterium]
MKRTDLKRILLAALTLVIFQACEVDDDTVVLEEDTETGTIDDGDNDEVAIGNSMTNRFGETMDLSDTTSELIVQWNELLLVLDRYATGMRPNATSRALAYIGLAAYETAVSEMPAYSSNTTRLNGFSLDAGQIPDSLNLDIALNACYARALDYFIYNVPNTVNSEIDDLEEEMLDRFSTDLTENVVEASQQWGRYVAGRVIRYSRSDSEAEEQIRDPQPFDYEPPVGDGFWTYSADAERAWYPYWRSVRTFVISTDETSTEEPYDEYSENPNSGYYEQMVEVYETNNTAREEQNEDLWIAEFWSDDVEGLMMSPPGRQISITAQLIEQYDLGMDEALALLLKVGFALNDAAVSCWDDKYTYMVMRPSVYIQEFIDPDFQTNLYKFIFWPNPSFPGYPSGHSTFASAAGGIFIDTFGDNTNFTDRSHEGRTDFLGTPRQFSTFSDMAEENAFSRIPLGVHIRMDCSEGLRLGYEIADAVNDFAISSGNDL